MFFFIGGVQPKTVTVDDTPRFCPVCGLAQARLRRVDHYLSLFFIPLFPVKRGDEVLICDRCAAVSIPDEKLTSAEVASAGKDHCTRCGTSLDPTFIYCPHCGSRV